MFFFFLISLSLCSSLPSHFFFICLIEKNTMQVLKLQSSQSTYNYFPVILLKYCAFSFYFISTLKTHSVTIRDFISELLKIKANPMKNCKHSTRYRQYIFNTCCSAVLNRLSQTHSFLYYGYKSLLYVCQEIWRQFKRVLPCRGCILCVCLPKSCQQLLVINHRMNLQQNFLSLLENQIGKVPGW